MMKYFTVLTCTTRITYFCRCSVTQTLELSEMSKCSFLQTHPIAHKGFKREFINTKVPSDLAEPCKISYYIGRKIKRLEIKFDSILVGSVYNIIKEFGYLTPVCTFSNFIEFI